MTIEHARPTNNGVEDNPREQEVTESEREEYDRWRQAKGVLRSATLAFAAGVGRQDPESRLMAMAREVSRLQTEERKKYSLVRLKVQWRRLTGVTTWPTPLASGFADF